MKLKLISKNTIKLEENVNEFLKKIYLKDYKVCEKFIHILYEEKKDKKVNLEEIQEKHLEMIDLSTKYLQNVLSDN